MNYSLSHEGIEQYLNEFELSHDSFQNTLGQHQESYFKLETPKKPSQTQVNSDFKASVVTTKSQRLKKQ